MQGKSFFVKSKLVELPIANLQIDDFNSERLIVFDEIHSIESFNKPPFKNLVIVYGKPSKAYVFRSTLKKIVAENSFFPKNFVQISRSCIINLFKVDQRVGKIALYIGEKRFEIGKEFKEIVSQRFASLGIVEQR